MERRACPVAFLGTPAHHIPPPRSHHSRQEAQDEKTLKRAFRRLALRYHPDIAKDDAGVEKFHEIQEAYRVLSGAELAHVELPQDQEWDTHDWRWAHRYKGAANGVAGIDPDEHRNHEDWRRGTKNAGGVAASIDGGRAVQAEAAGHQAAQ